MGILTRELSQAVALATGSQPGPVHMNVPIREPLLEGGAPEISVPIESQSPPDIADIEWPPGFDFTDFASARGVVVIGRLPGVSRRMSV
jgi:2-succinyl-5-enolpyruvyl-6-hydroxy-3-cyclohexene-1-carboxylate synthase